MSIRRNLTRSLSLWLLGFSLLLLPFVAAAEELGKHVYEELAAEDPQFKKVMDNYFAFKAEHDIWAAASEEVWHGQLRSSDDDA